jgi:hypothetical protein
VDLRGEPDGKPVKIRNGSFNIKLAAFTPASFVFETASQSAAAPTRRQVTKVAGGPASLLPHFIPSMNN